MKKKVSKVGGHPPKGETTQKAEPVASVDPAKVAAMAEQLANLVSKFEATAAENKSLKDQVASYESRARRSVQTEQEQAQEKMREQFAAETPESEQLPGVIFQSPCPGFRQIIKPSKETHIGGNEWRLTPPRVVEFTQCTVRLTAEEDIAGMRVKIEEARKRGGVPMVREVTPEELRAQTVPVVDPFAVAPAPPTASVAGPSTVSTTGVLPETANALEQSEGPQAGFERDHRAG